MKDLKMVVSSLSDEVPKKDASQVSTQLTLVNPRGYLTRPPPVNRPVRVYVHGVWDLFHIGQAARSFPNPQEISLIVLVPGM
jgi:hypothetical protein